VVDHRRPASVDTSPGRDVRAAIRPPPLRSYAARAHRPPRGTGVDQRSVGGRVGAGHGGEGGQLLGKSLRAAVDAGLLATNPAERVRLPKIEREEMRFLAPDQVAWLADTIDSRYRTLVLVGAYGLRFGELAALRRDRVDVMRGRLDVAETVVEVKGHHHVGPPKTRAGRRAVPLPRSVSTALADHVADLPQDALVFPAPEGGFLRASLFRRRTWHPAVDRAGLTPLRPHDLRHTAVAFWIAAGASPKEVAARAGHTSVVTVPDRYGHLLPGSEERVTDALEAMAQAAKIAPSAPVVALHQGRA
jgi:integrase